MSIFFSSKAKSILLYSSLFALLFFLLKWLEYRLIIVNHALEIFIGAIALIFLALGIWLALKLSKPKIEKVFIEREVPVHISLEFSLNEAERNQLGISKRELEVLHLMSEGLSNHEIATRLFVSLNTIKTHVSNLFEKLEVKRRTQAVEKAKRLSLIP